MGLDRSILPATAGGRLLCWAGAGLGLIGLVGCVTGVDALATLIPGQPPMVPSTCLALTCLGLAGAVRRPDGSGVVSVSLIASSAVLALVLTMVAERLPGFPFSLDHLLMGKSAGPSSPRSSLPVAIALTLLSCAILTYGHHTTRRFHPAEWLIVCAGLIAFGFALLPLFDPIPTAPYSATIIAGVPAPVAISLVLISAGLLLEEPNSGVMQIANSATPGGIMLRQLIPPVIVIGLAVGLAASLLTDIAGPQNAAFVRTGATLFGIAVAFPLFIITARHLNRAHQALERSEARYRELVQLAADGIFAADLEGRFTEVNDAGCRLLGFSREEILGKTIMDFILPEEKERLFRDRDKFLKGGSDVSEWMLRRKDGSYVPVEVNAKILPDGRWIAIDRDLSERRQAEKTIRQTQDHLELAIRGGDLASWDWNIETGEMVTNDKCAEMRGYQAGETAHKVDWYIESVHPADASGFLGALSDCLNDVRPEFEHEYRASTKSGEWIWLLSHGKVFERDKQGRPIRMVGTSVDITKRKSTEEALRLSEGVAKQASQARDDILAVVAHDLRNPLATISMLAAALQRTGPQHDIGNEIAHATNRMTRLIQDLIDLTLLDAGRFSIKQGRIPPAALISEVYNSQALLASSASLDLRIEALSELPDISADHDRLLQVFENLVGNALKFTKAGGEIILDATARNDEVAFSVTDTGSGISSEQLPHVFDRFWQGREGKRRGAGLGLPIVKGIVEAHGGRVWVQSTPGQGSTFFFTVPVANASRDYSGETVTREQKRA